MRILHLWDCAGVACVLARYLKRLGVDVHVLVRAKHDSYGIYRHYGEVAEINGKDRFGFVADVLSQARLYDLIHIHYVYQFLPLLRFLYPRKPLIMHWHGSDLRNRNPFIIASVNSLADYTYVSTEDLRGPRVEWLPNPVDTEHFRLFDHYRDTRSVALPSRGYYAWGADLPLNRQTSRIPYAEMPSFLSGFRRYWDLRYNGRGGRPLPCLSLTGLQALACGLSVWTYRLQWEVGLPREHRPENVARTVLERYSQLLSVSSPVTASA